MEFYISTPNPQSTLNNGPSLWFGLSILVGLLGFLLVFTYRTRGVAGVQDGFARSFGLFAMVLPNLLLGFTVAGFMQVLLPREGLVRWVGQESGWRGLSIASIAGMLTPGGPFTQFPILASLLELGMAVGPVSAYIAAWSLLGIHRILVWELPILGGKLVAIRIASCFFIPPLIGALSQGIFNRLR